MRSGFELIHCGLAVLFVSASIAAEPINVGLVTVTVSSREKIQGVLKSWTADKIVVKTTVDQEILIADLQSIVFEHPLKKLSTGESTVWLSNGDQISAKTVEAANESLTVSWLMLGSKAHLKIPLERVATMIFEWPATTSERQRLSADIASLPSGNDLVIFKSGDRSQGEFERLDSAFAELKGATGTLKLDRSRIRAIRLNPELTTGHRGVHRRNVLSLSDGSRITASSIEFIDDRINLVTSELGKLSLPLTSVVECQFFGETSIPISDYEPAKIKFTPYLSTNWKLVRNSNVQHGPLTLRDHQFLTGLGMHSQMAVTYDLRGNEREFQAVVGIDDIAKGAGSVIFAVELDGRQVWTSPELTGKSPAMNLPSIRVQGGKQLTLIVNYGQYADVSDYADWCDAVMIVDPSQGLLNPQMNRKSAKE